MSNKELLRYIRVNGVTLESIKGNNLYGVTYRDPPGVTEVSFWRDVVNSDLPEKWFGDRLDMTTIEYDVSPGQYNIGCDVRARGKLINVSKETVQEVKDILKEKKELLRQKAAINKEIAKLEKERRKLDHTDYVDLAGSV